MLSFWNYTRVRSFAIGLTGYTDLSIIWHHIIVTLFYRGGDCRGSHIRRDGGD